MQYDLLLLEIIKAVSENTSREDLLILFLDRLTAISSATAIAVLEVAPSSGDRLNSAVISGNTQRGIHMRRWQLFLDRERFKVPSDSVIHDVIEDGLEIDMWSTTYFHDEFSVFKSLFNIDIGGWIAGIRLPRATAQHNNQGIFLWYESPGNPEQLPRGADQDWRMLSLYQGCHQLAGHAIRKAAKTIIKQRQELLQMLTPSILNHEIHARIDFFKLGLIRTRDDIAQYIHQLKGEQDGIPILKQVLSRIDNQLLRHAERLHSISGSVMGLTRRISSGKTDLVAETQAAIDLLAISASKANVDLTMAPPIPDIPIVKSDPALFMHVMVNLINNAIEALAPITLSDFKSSKRAWIEIIWDSTPDLTHPLVLHVCDNGTGIELAQSTRIFEPGITTKPGGHGLGLAICQMITTYLGGILSITSLKNPTRFSLQLPLSAPKVSDLEEELRSEAEKL